MIYYQKIKKKGDPHENDSKKHGGVSVLLR